MNALLQTLEELAAFGEKRVGTAAGRAAGEYVLRRFAAAGLSDARFEEFHFPRHEVVRSSCTLYLDGAGVSGPLEHAAFEGAAAGGAARGAVALVERNPLYHRSTQYLEAVEAGARAMLSISAAPGNLPQAGSVRRAWEACGAIPAISIGAADGKRVRAALDARVAVELAIEVEVELSRGRGRNVLGQVPGDGLAQIVIGAHYDTWFAGSTDNGGGVAALLAIAERRAARARPRHTLTFVAWDGEEVALYGGYDFLRRHRVVGREPILAVLDLETPSAHGAQAYGLARSAHAPLERAIVAAQLHELYAMNVTMDFVPELFGGVIPTDVQGIYRAGTPSLATAVDSPYYHTAADTPDKVDLPRLAETVEGFDRALDRLLAEPPDRFTSRDPALWRLDAVAHPSAGALAVEVAVANATGTPRAAATVEAVLLDDYFFERASASTRTDATGRATLRLTHGDLRHPAFLHLTAGERYPLVEHIIPID